MPYKETGLIQIKELHSTFGAEISGVDFSERVNDDVFEEILAAITKVVHRSILSYHTFTISQHLSFNNQIQTLTPNCSMESVCFEKLV